jgi:hypothetical protein
MDRLLESLATFPFSSPLTLWLAGSWLVYVLGTNLLWLLRALPIWRWPYIGWIKEIGRLLFFLGVPYLILGGWPQPPFSGRLSPDDLGFAGIGPLWPATRWLSSLGTGLGLGFVAILFLLLARWAAVGAPPVVARGGARLDLPPLPWWRWLLDVLYHQVHWAFYRTALAALLGDLYAGVFAGLGLVYLEWGMDPFWRQGWKLPEEAGERWLRLALALIAALIFLLTRNLWVCLAVHALALVAFHRRLADS